MTYWCLKKGKRFFPETIKRHKYRVMATCTNLMGPVNNLGYGAHYWPNWDEAGYSIVRVKIVEVQQHDEHKEA